MPRPATFDDLTDGKSATKRTLTFVLDSDAADEYERAEAEVQRLESLQREAAVRGSSLAPSMAAELEEARERFDAVCQRMDDEGIAVTMTFQGIGREAYDALVAKYPPNQKQREEAKKKGQPTPIWNHDAFAPALVAESLIEPELTLEQVKVLWRDPKWNQAELGSMFGAALEVNSFKREVDLGKGSTRTPSSESESVTP